MYPLRIRLEALARLSTGVQVSQVSRELHISRAAIRDWRDGGLHASSMRERECPRCAASTMDLPDYAALLGFYLGDGVISAMPRYFSFRVSCDRSYPGIIDDVEGLLRRLRPDSRVFRVPAPGVIVVQANWKHWPCVFPQHGPGRKTDRPIVLEAWQREIVDAHPEDLLRGLFHSDGARVHNWTVRTVAGQPKRYEYPRWQFSNRSEDILGLCSGALDRLGIAWRRSSQVHLSVSRREAVAALDAAIGLKS